MCIRAARIEELPSVLNVIDGAVLQVEIETLKRAIRDDDVLVAVVGESDNERVLGALVLDGIEITALAVRLRRRGQGIGTALVEAAFERHGELSAECDEGVVAFWQSVGFDVGTAEGFEGGTADESTIGTADGSERYRGRRER